MEIYSGLLKFQRLTAEAMGLVYRGSADGLARAVGNSQQVTQGAGQTAMAVSTADQTEARDSRLAENLAQRQERQRQEQDEIERRFDNMPI